MLDIYLISADISLLSIWLLLETRPKRVWMTDTVNLTCIFFPVANTLFALVMIFMILAAIIHDPYNLFRPKK